MLEEALSLNILHLVAIYYDLAIFENQQNLRCYLKWKKLEKKLFFLIILILQQDIIINNFFNDQEIVKNHWDIIKIQTDFRKDSSYWSHYLTIIYNNLVNLFINQGKCEEN